MFCTYLNFMLCPQKDKVEVKPIKTYFSSSYFEQKSLIRERHEDDCEFLEITEINHLYYLAECLQTFLETFPSLLMSQPFIIVRAKSSKSEES